MFCEHDFIVRLQIVGFVNYFVTMEAELAVGQSDDFLKVDFFMVAELFSNSPHFTSTEIRDVKTRVQGFYLVTQVCNIMRQFRIIFCFICESV